ncbi:MAG: hypothetical protein WB524_25955 [Acidobacteriaceae bacterium]
MSQVLIDGELVWRIMEAHFELDADNRAYRKLASKASMTNFPAAQRFVEHQAAEAKKELSHFANHLKTLRSCLDSEDDAGVQSFLRSHFPEDRR